MLLANIINPVAVGAGFNHHFLGLFPLQQVFQDNLLHGDRLGLSLIGFGIEQASHALEFSEVNCENLHTSLRDLSLSGSETSYPQGYRRFLLTSHGLHRFSSFPGWSRDPKLARWYLEFGLIMPEIALHLPR
jgi:hypothetical protein